MPHSCTIGFRLRWLTTSHYPTANCETFSLFKSQLDTATPDPERFTDRYLAMFHISASFLALLPFLNVVYLSKNAHESIYVVRKSKNVSQDFPQSHIRPGTIWASENASPQDNYTRRSGRSTSCKSRRTFLKAKNCSIYDCSEQLWNIFQSSDLCTQEKSIQNKAPHFSSMKDLRI